MSVIIPVFDDPERLALCLRALQAQTYPAQLVEVLVVDNASTRPPDPALPQDPRFRLLREPVPGSYAARNAALAVARGPVLAFTDADCLPEPEWLAEGVRSLLLPGTAMVGGAIELFFPEARRLSGPALYEAQHAFPQERYVTEEGFAATANMLTWSRTVEEVGPFNARLASQGDAEWGRRVAAAGGLQRWAPGAVVRHPARVTWSEFTRKVVRVARGKRDIDLARGEDASYFRRQALSSLVQTGRTAVAVWLRPTPARWTHKLRYLTAYGVARLIIAAVMARASSHPSARSARG